FDSYVDAPYGKSCFCLVAVIGCFHMSGLFVRHTLPLALIKLARLNGALNQTGLPLHWLDRYASSTAIANSVRAARG
ncbi:hypothetical protein FMN50_21630, partial [Rhodobacterales bacterium]